MYERFSDRARKIMALANKEAERFNHECIGSEHILLALIQEKGVASAVLENLKIDPLKIRLEVEKRIKCGPEPTTLGKKHLTVRAKAAIADAIGSANILHHNYVGTEHLLHGLSFDSSGVSANVLQSVGATPDKIEAAIKEIIAPEKAGEGLRKLIGLNPIDIHLLCEAAKAGSSSAQRTLDAWAEKVAEEAGLLTDGHSSST